MIMWGYRWALLILGAGVALTVAARFSNTSAVGAGLLSIRRDRCESTDCIWCDGAIKMAPLDHALKKIIISGPKYALLRSIGRDA